LIALEAVLSCRLTGNFEDFADNQAYTFDQDFLNLMPLWTVIQILLSIFLHCSAKVAGKVETTSQKPKRYFAMKL
jgi:hypothetical protein